MSAVEILKQTKKTHHKPVKVCMYVCKVNVTAGEKDIHLTGRLGLHWSPIPLYLSI